MNLIKGFIVWGAIVVILGVLLFLFWKLFLCTRTGYESRKKEMGSGIIAIVCVFATLLFIPIFFLQSDSVMVSLVEALREDTVKSASDNFKENIDKELELILDNMIVEQQIMMTPELEEVKKNAIATSVKFTRNKPFIDTIETALRLFNVDDVPVIDSSSYDLLAIADEKVQPYGKLAAKTEIPTSSLKWLFGNCINTTPFSALSGIESEEILENAAKALHNMLAKFFIILNSIIAFVISLFIFINILLLKEPKDKLLEENDRRYLFEFDRINKVTGKKISDELNQYN